MWPISFLHGLDALPTAIPDPLLPKTDLVIPPTHRQHIPTQTPAHPPNLALKLQRLALPVLGHAQLRPLAQRPDPHRPVLRPRRNVRRRQQVPRPRHVPHPVRVARQRHHVAVRPALRAVLPHPDRGVGTRRREPPHGRVRGVPRRRGRRLERPRRERGRPAHGVDARGMRLEDGGVPGGAGVGGGGIAREGEDGDGAVRGRAGEVGAELVGRPGDGVDRGGVQREVDELGVRAGRGGGVLAPEEDFACEVARGEDGAVFGVGVGEGEDG